MQWASFGLLLVLCAAGCRALDPAYCDENHRCTDPALPACHPTGHYCIQPPDGGVLCKGDEDCSDPARPRCDQPTALCVPCQAEMNAAVCAHFRKPERPHCVAAGPGKATSCVECLADADCRDPARPICQADTHACQSCQEHIECGPDSVCSDGTRCKNSWVCIHPGDAVKDDGGVSLGGRCALNGPGGRVVYVGGLPEAGTCKDPGNPGFLPSLPKCTLEDALKEALASRRDYVRLLGVPPPLPATMAINNTNGRRLIFVGAPNKTMMRPAQVNGMDTLITVSGGARVTLDTLILRELTINKIAVSCTDSALTMRGCKLQGATTAPEMVPHPGLRISDCDTVLDRNYVGASNGQRGHGSGITIIDSVGHSYRIENNIIAGNLGPALDLSSAISANLQFGFNTVTQNGDPKASFGGILCPAAGPLKSLYASIIFRNSTYMAGGSQFLLSRCDFDNTVTGKDEPQKPGMINKDPALDSNLHFDMSDAARKKANQDCCIDKVPPMPGLPDHDIDNGRRPQPKNGRWDIGAYELPQ